MITKLDFIYTLHEFCSNKDVGDRIQLSDSVTCIYTTDKFILSLLYLHALVVVGSELT